jgi:hypothetical protein
VSGGEAQITIHPDQAGKSISPDLFGVFFEDLPYAADGGLCTKPIQNRSLEFQAAEQPNWTPMTARELCHFALRAKRTAGSGAGYCPSRVR